MHVVTPLGMARAESAYGQLGTRRVSHLMAGLKHRSWVIVLPLLEQP